MYENSYNFKFKWDNPKIEYNHIILNFFANNLIEIQSFQFVL